jgi:phosphopantothenoylcysteine synthetase/decarboxylase
VTVIARDGKAEELKLMSKTDLAEVLLDRVERELNGR